MGLSEGLRAAVRASGLTAYAVSRATGVDETLIGRWLRGERDITLGTADRLAAGLGITVQMSRDGRGRGASPQRTAAVGVGRRPRPEAN